MIAKYFARVAESLPEHGVTSYEAAVRDSCKQAAAFIGEESRGLCGIVFKTELGERFPETWKQMDSLGQRLRPRQFGQAVLNAGPGYATISLGIGGPQVVVVDGNAEEVARLLLGTLAPFHVIVCEDHGDYMEGGLLTE